METDVKTRIEQIRKRIVRWRQEAFHYGIDTAINDIDFLLSIVKGQEAEVEELKQIAETRSDLIAAKAAHVDHLQSQLRQTPSTTSLLRRLKDFLFDNCDHSERDRNYDWCPTCVMAFMEVVAIPSDSDAATSMHSRCVETVKAMIEYEAVNGERRGAMIDVVRELESLSIQEQK